MQRLSSSEVPPEQSAAAIEGKSDNTLSSLWPLCGGWVSESASPRMPEVTRKKKHQIFDGTKVHVRRKQCATCIFGNKSPVDAERVASMIKECGDMGAIPCHHHLGEKINPVCFGFYSLGNNVLLRLATAMDVIEWHGEDPLVT